MPIVRKLNPHMNNFPSGEVLSYCYYDHAPDDIICRKTFDDIRYFFLDECLEPSEIDEDRIPLIIDALVEIRIQDAAKRHETLNLSSVA